MRRVSHNIRSASAMLVFLLAFAFGVVSNAAPPAQKKPHSVNLKWDSSETEIMGYNVYRASKSGGPYKKLTRMPVSMPEYTDTDVQGGQTYFYTVSTVYSKKVESRKSAEIVASVPNP